MFKEVRTGNVVTYDPITDGSELANGHWGSNPCPSSRRAASALNHKVISPVLVILIKKLFSNSN